MESDYLGGLMLMAAYTQVHFDPGSQVRYFTTDNVLQ